MQSRYLILGRDKWNGHDTIVCWCSFIQPKYWLLGCFHHNKHDVIVANASELQPRHWILGYVQRDKQATKDDLVDPTPYRTALSTAWSENA
jgi:hypothetical protein